MNYYTRTFIDVGAYFVAALIAKLIFPQIDFTAFLGIEALIVACFANNRK